MDKGAIIFSAISQRQREISIATKTFFSENYEKAPSESLVIVTSRFGDQKKANFYLLKTSSNHCRGLRIYFYIDMKLNRNQYKQMCSRLDRLVVIVALLWLATSLALLFSYRPESAQTVHQHSAAHGSVASHVLKLPLGRL